MEINHGILKIRLLTCCLLPAPQIMDDLDLSSLSDSKET